MKLCTEDSAKLVAKLAEHVYDIVSMSNFCAGIFYTIHKAAYMHEKVSPEYGVVCMLSNLAKYFCWGYIKGTAYKFFFPLAIVYHSACEILSVKNKHGFKPGGFFSMFVPNTKYVAPTILKGEYVEVVDDQQ